MTPEMQAKITLWRQQALRGELSKEDLVEAIKYIRDGRVSAQATSSKAREKKAPVNSADLLAELGL